MEGVQIPFPPNNRRRKAVLENISKFIKKHLTKHLVFVIIYK